MVTETLDNVNGYQGKLLNISILSFSVKEVAAKIINNVLETIVIVLNQKHANSAISSSEIKSIVTMVIRWTQ